jgi:3-aminobutyryl-CoA ammonia-lyase
MYSGAANDRHSHAYFGDVVTEGAVITDGDECLFVGYGEVGFLAPIRTGDFLEVTGIVTRIGTTSRTVRSEARKVIASRYDDSPSGADVLDMPVVADRAVGTTVVGKEHSPWPGRQEPTNRVTDAVHLRTGDIRLVGAEELARLAAADTGDALRTQARPEAALLVDLFRHVGGVAGEVKSATRPGGGRSCRAPGRSRSMWWARSCRGTRR